MSDEPRATASASYAGALLQKALVAATQDPDPEVRKRALAKAERWRAVIEGMASGLLTVGSRTPVADTPAWVTLEVVHGGFATGRYLAEGELQEHERALLAQVGDRVRGSTERERLNAWYLGDEGQQQLVEAVEAGRYRLALPEEGALPVVAWLLERGHAVLALELIETLRPLMHRLRFYPKLEAVARPAGATVRLVPVGQIVRQLESARPHPRVAAMNEALRVWNPLFDALVALWLDTVGEDGWPCRRWPADFGQRRQDWLDAYRKAARAHKLCRKHAHPKSNFARLRSALERCTADPPYSQRLTGRDVGWIRRALQGTLTRLGAPGSERREALRREQALVAARPLNAELAHLLARRLAVWPSDGGLPSLEAVSLEAREAEHPQVPAGTAIPASLLAKAERALEAPIEELIARKVIPSSEVLAQVLPQVTSQVAAAGIEDAALRGLFEQIYAAFRKRRSLLLLNLEHQVRLEELPWVAAVQRFRTDNLGTQAQARQTLEQVTWLALSSFPQTLLPNPLIREMKALSERAGLKLPLVEEVAADIFMGTFTEKWALAADRASRLLEGTLYARYYDLPPPSQQPRQSPRTKRWGKAVADDFAALCRQRAAEAGSGGSWVAQNGAILEQSQILTTHNLAVLVHELGLTERLAAQAPELADQIFEFIVQQHNQPSGHFQAELQRLKNTAYAWRQAIFLLSLCETGAQWEAVARLEAKLSKQDKDWVARFRPAVAGLRMILKGGRFGADGRGSEPKEGIRFLGWAAGRHWMLGPDPQRPAR